MSSFLLTTILAFILVLLALAGMAIGWLLTGTSRFQRMCGYRPGQKRDEQCGDNASCPVCGDDTKKS